MQLMAKTAKIIPTTKEPVSPINILAGKVLNFKNPTKAPDNVKAIKAISVCSIIKAIAPNERDEIKPIPPAKPSMPSIRLKPFVITITTKIVTVSYTHLRAHET